MTKPMLLADFQRLPPVWRAQLVDGLSGVIDTVAAAAPVAERHRCYHWYHAAVRAFGGGARTLIVEREGMAVAALPITAFGPAFARCAKIPGGTWPGCGFAFAAGAGRDAFDMVADALARHVNALRIGPVAADDVSVGGLIAAMRGRGWAVLDRRIEAPFDTARAAIALATRDVEGLAIVAARHAVAAAGRRHRPPPVVQHAVFWDMVMSDAVIRRSLAMLLEQNYAQRGTGGNAMHDWLLIRPGVTAAVGRMLTAAWPR